jgi:hypothetical protein
MRLPRARIRAAALAGVAAGLALTVAPSGSSAAPIDPFLQERIDLHLNQYPGGKQISANQISYDGGEAVMTFAMSGEVLAAVCPSGYVCLYTERSFAGDHLDLNTCSWYDLAWRNWQDKTKSVRNARSGTVAFDNHGSVPSHASDTWLFTINAGASAASLGAHEGKADHIRPRC